MSTPALKKTPTNYRIISPGVKLQARKPFGFTKRLKSPGISIKIRLWKQDLP